MTTRTDLLEFAEELGERFPNLPDVDVYDACCDYYGKPIGSSDVLWLDALKAYLKGSETNA